MLPWMWIFEIVLFCAAGRRALADSPNRTTCEEFERGARFSPYAVIDTMWKIFYFWADNTELYPIVFALPAKKRVHRFKETVEALEPDLIEWDKATLFMNARPGAEVIFLYAGTPGAFRALVVQEQRQGKVRPYPEPLIKFADVRLKIEDRYLGMMCCEDLTSFALARIGNMPLTETHCEIAAGKLGLHGPGGRSYLYVKKMLKQEEL